MAASRTAFRITSSPLLSTRSAFRSSNATTFRQTLFRQQQTRVQSTSAEISAEGSSKLQQFWNSKVGPKTVHFWAPVMKWALVLAGVSDFARPASSLSLNTNAALMATGAIWTRWCLIIKPRNVFLAAVNFFLFLVGTTQCTRIMLYRRSQGEDIGEEVKGAAVDAKDDIVGAVKDPKGAFEKVKYP